MIVVFFFPVSVISILVFPVSLISILVFTAGVFFGLFFGLSCVCEPRLHKIVSVVFSRCKRFAGLFHEKSKK